MSAAEALDHEEVPAEFSDESTETRGRRLDELVATTPGKSEVTRAMRSFRFCHIISP